MIALFVAVLLTVSFGAKVSAVSAAPSEEQRLEDAVARIKYDIPDADVTVADGIIHIILDDPEKIPGYSTPKPGLETNTTSVSCYNGGSYWDFQLTWSAWSYFAPTYQVFMPAPLVEPLKIKLSRPDIVQWILSQSMSMTATAISIEVSKMPGYTVVPASISLIISLTFHMLLNIQYYALEQAQNQTEKGRVYVVYGTTPDGLPSYLYFPWKTSTCNTYCGYEATWHAEEYD